MIFDNAIKTIGNTPIVKLNTIGKDLDVELYAKLEYFNPGGSIKDRIGYWLIEDAEKSGKLKPGGTIIEGTSGNTGFGLAIAAAIKGYKCIFVLPDKMSDEKIKSLRAFGAKVVVTPTAVEPEDPRSYYSVSRRLATETPNSFYVDQYNNLANRDCHYKTTGPEILKQMPDMDVFIAGIGTGGTVCGNGKYFKENKPSVEVVAVDPVGSIVYDKFKTGKDVPAKTYIIEGIGEDFIPMNYDFDVIDDMVQVEDKESFLMTRDLLTKEGIYAGISSGSAVVGAIKWVKQQGARVKGKKVLIIIPDSGNRYLSKAFDDDWMKEAGFLEKKSLGSVSDLMSTLNIKKGEVFTVRPKDKVSHAAELLRTKNISQLPVVDEKNWIKGIIKEDGLLKALYEGKAKQGDTIDAFINSAFECVSEEDSIEKVSKILTDGKTVLVTDGKKEATILAILTKIDLISFIGAQS